MVGVFCWGHTPSAVTFTAFVEVYSEDSIQDIVDTAKEGDSHFVYELAMESICNPVIPIAPPTVRGQLCRSPSLYMFACSSPQLVGSITLPKKERPMKEKEAMVARVQDKQLLEMKDEGLLLFYLMMTVNTAQQYVT